MKTSFLKSAIYRFGVFMRFFFFIISIIFITQLVVFMSGKGLMEYFLSVPYQKSANNDGFSFSIETTTEYNLSIDVVAYGQKKIAIKVFRVEQGGNIDWLDKFIPTHEANKNSIFFPINLKEGDYYFRLPYDKLKNIRLYPRKPTSLISSLFNYLDGNMLVWIILPVTGGISFFYLFFYFLPHLIRKS
ncbi:MAG: hypothetical protein ACJAZP_001882 [Psychromonas sp.]|jgi:hypothetical protein|uniref:hypothetical protein n=1 Tax=Psychromonas sp. TaxID=1884585 RepID=UPI0039E496A4